jgi:muramoyltetrapeptide carboxypeptidase
MRIPALKYGDTIAIAAPARSISYEQLTAAKNYVESKGFKIYLHPELYAVDHQFAGTDDHRANVMNDLLKHQEVKAIWCARGGYGSLRMIDKIDFNLLIEHPKWLIGFSDITVLHSHIHQNCTLPTIHGTMPIFMNEKEGAEYQDVCVAIDSFLTLLMGESYLLDLTKNEKINERDFSGEIVGGNLSVLVSILDSVSETKFDNKILFIEDLDEYYYHLDRMLLMLKRSGRLTGLKALLVGSFIQMHDHTIPFGKNTKSIITDHCQAFGYPIIFDINAGHHLQNLAIPFGLTSIYQNGILTFATT